MGIAEKQELPDKWDAETGENVLWRTSIPGLANSSPIVWGDRIFVTTAISRDPRRRSGRDCTATATRRRTVRRSAGSSTRSTRTTANLLWERVAYEVSRGTSGTSSPPMRAPRPPPTGALSSRGSGGRAFAYDVDGNFRWKVDLGRINMGAYDIPRYEWGPASSPILSNGFVILQCDTQADSFLPGLNADTGERCGRRIGKSCRRGVRRRCSTTSGGPELVTNTSNLVRGYDPRTGTSYGGSAGSSKIAAPTPVFAGDLIVLSSGRARAPYLVVRPGRAATRRRPRGPRRRRWSWSGADRAGTLLPTPLFYNGILYVLADDGVFDA